MNEQKTIYELKLHEVTIVEWDDRYLFTTVMRVPTGWIYRSYDRSYGMMSTAFVPETEE